MMQATSEDNEQIAHVHAAVEHQGPNQQYVVLQTPTEYEGKAFNLLVDSGATHSFISPACVRKLNLSTHKDSKLSVKLATGKATQSTTSVNNLQFSLGGYQTNATF